jgi:hypothetical protein
MHRFKAPVDWHIGEVTEVAVVAVGVKGEVRGTRCKHGQVKAVYQSESHGQDPQNHELVVERHGVQGDWVVLEPEATAVTDRGV